MNSVLSVVPAGIADKTGCVFPGSLLDTYDFVLN
jgi:hypothetical protein